MACLKAQHANLLGELQTVGKKAVQYLHDLHLAKSDLCSYREELFKLNSGCFKLPQPLSSVNLFLSIAHLQLLLLPLYTTRWGRGGQIPVREPAMIETLQSFQNIVPLTPSPAMVRPPGEGKGGLHSNFGPSLQR